MQILFLISALILGGGDSSSSFIEIPSSIVLTDQECFWPPDLVPHPHPPHNPKKDEPKIV